MRTFNNIVVINNMPTRLISLHDDHSSARAILGIVEDVQVVNQLVSREDNH
jgi:hypothetical protein